MQARTLQAHLWRLGSAVVMALLLLVIFLVLSSLIMPGTLPPIVEGVVPAAPVAEARVITRVISPEIVPEVLLVDDGVRVRGIIQCTSGPLELRVTVEQNGNSSKAIAFFDDICTGHTQNWVVDVPHGSQPFKRGDAKVHVWSKTHGDNSPSHEWDSNARVVGRDRR